MKKRPMIFIAIAAFGALMLVSLRVGPKFFCEKGGATWDTTRGHCILKTELNRSEPAQP